MTHFPKTYKHMVSLRYLIGAKFEQVDTVFFTSEKYLSVGTCSIFGAYN